jgi:spore coat protein U-like protein
MPAHYKPLKRALIFVLTSALVLPAILYAPPSHAWMNCSFSSAPTLNFGAVDVLGGVYPTTSVTINATCTKGGADIGTRGYLCLNIGDGSGADPIRGSRDTYAPRLISNGSNYAGFQIYTDPGYSNFWGTYAPNGNPHQLFFDFSAGKSVTQSLTFYGRIAAIAPVLNGTTTLETIAPASYNSSFVGGHTLWESTLLTNQTVGTNCTPQWYNRSGQFPFSVAATVVPNCKIKGSIANIDFGTNPTTATNLQANTTLTVQCTRTTPYAIGLKPSNNNANGAGVMNHISSPGDTVAYQLRKATGMSAAAWGNTTAVAPGAAGNGVQGTGTGADQNYIIYATVASANSAAGDYMDTVLTTVTY